jgi:hypothetical protein
MQADTTFGATMEHSTRHGQARAGALAKMLGGSRDASVDQLSALVCAILEASGIPPERRVEVLGGAFVTEAIRPHWGASPSPEAAHEALSVSDPELAEAVEALSILLLGRAETRETASVAIRAFEDLLRTRP